MITKNKKLILCQYEKNRHAKALQNSLYYWAINSFKISLIHKMIRIMNFFDHKRKSKSISHLLRKDVEVDGMDVITVDAVDPVTISFAVVSTMPDSFVTR